jgi:23S rRNA (adenine-N6)-dimethyltransferase
MSSARVPPARPGGRHLLRSSGLARAIVDIGAGSGMLTRALVEAGARVVAIEPDRRLGAKLGRLPATVQQTDAAHADWPREPFRVVANLPFARAAEICRALFSDPRMPLCSADLIVEWDFAAKRARLWPSTAQTVIWNAWYELAVVRRIEARAFVPVPSVAAGVLRATRRGRPLVRPADAAGYERFVRRGFRGDRARERDPHAWAAAWRSRPGADVPFRR